MTRVNKYDEMSNTYKDEANLFDIEMAPFQRSTRAHTGFKGR